MIHKLSGALALILCIALGIVPKAHALSFTNDQTTDVGDLLGNAGITDTQPAGTVLDSISGSLTPNGTDNVDLYKVYLPAGNFIASTVGGTNMNSQLFLFNSSGIGITANNDASISSFQSQISQTISTAGNYYLGISTEGFNPQSAGGNVFMIDSFTTGVQDPASAGVGAGSPLNSWSTGFATGNEGYTISLSGAQFVSSATPVPFEFDSNFGLLLLCITWGGWRYMKQRRFGWKN